MRGPDRHYTLEVGFLEAAQGATRRITLPDGQVLDVKIPRASPTARRCACAARAARGSAAARPATRW